MVTVEGEPVCISHAMLVARADKSDKVDKGEAAESSEQAGES